MLSLLAILVCHFCHEQQYLSFHSAAVLIYALNAWETKLEKALERETLGKFLCLTDPKIHKFHDGVKENPFNDPL